MYGRCVNIFIINSRFQVLFMLEPEHIGSQCSYLEATQIL